MNAGACWVNERLDGRGKSVAGGGTWLPAGVGVETGGEQGWGLATSPPYKVRRKHTRAHPQTCGRQNLKTVSPIMPNTRDCRPLNPALWEAELCKSETSLLYR